MSVLSASHTERGRGSGKRLVALGLTAIGAVLLLWSAIIHLYLYTDSFSHVPTIGPLFFAQGVTAIACALALVIFRSVLLALFGALLLISTAFGLLLSAWIGLFNYHEHLSTPYAGMSLIVEFVGAVVLLMAAAALRRSSASYP